MQKKKNDRKSSSMVGKAALIFGSGTLTSRILGLIRDALILSVMPVDMKDAWFGAFKVPNFFRRLLGEGGLSVSFIPIYLETQKKESAEELKSLSHGVFTLLMSVVGLICLLSILFMDQLIPLWLSGEGFSGVPGKMEMAVLMAQIMMGFLFFITLFAYFMALLNSAKKFALSGFAPVGLNLSIIGGLYFFKGSPHLVTISALVVVVGGAFQAFILLPQIVSLGLLPKISFSSINHKLVKKVLRKFMPTFLGVGVLQVLGLINAAFASQEVGAMTYLYNADRLLELPLSLIAVSLGTTLLPTLSEYWAKGDKGLFRSCVEKHYQLFYFLALPAAFGLWFMGTDIIQVLFVRGEYSTQEAVIVGTLLQVYAFTLLASGSLKIFNQSFYATQDTLTPALISVVGIIIHILMAPFWMSQYGLQGLVLSTALTTGFNLIVSIFILTKRLGALQWMKLFPHFIKCFIAASCMGAYLYALRDVAWKQGRFLLDFPILIVLITIGALIYFAMSLILKVDEVHKLKKRFF